MSKVARQAARAMQLIAPTTYNDDNNDQKMDDGLLFESNRISARTSIVVANVVANSVARAARYFFWSIIVLRFCCFR